MKCEVRSGVCAGGGYEVMEYRSRYGVPKMVMCCVNCFRAVRMLEPSRTVYVDLRSELLSTMVDEI